MLRSLVLNRADRRALALTSLPAVQRVTLAADDLTAPEWAVDFLQQFRGQLNAVHVQPADKGLSPPLGPAVVNTLADMPLLDELLIPSLPLPRNAFTALLRRPAEAFFPRLVGLQARLTSVTLVRVRIAGGADGNVLSVAAELRALKVLDVVFLDGANLRGTQL
jgi:hypothetical protein